jgi:hypothetical protein
MPLIVDEVVHHKGFYTSTKAPIMEKHGNLYGNFAFSLDYVLQKGIHKDIMTARKFVVRHQLETLLDNLFDKYGNYHLNYILFFPCAILNECSGVDKYNDEINRYVMSFNGKNLPQHVPFDKNILYGEFYKIKTIIRTKPFSKQTGKILFVNDNIFSIYMYTGMNRAIQ